MNRKNLSVMRSNSITLRPIGESDTDLIVSWRNKAAVGKNGGCICMRIGENLK